MVLSQGSQMIGDLRLGAELVENFPDDLGHLISTSVGEPLCEVADHGVRCLLGSSVGLSATS